MKQLVLQQDQYVESQDQQLIDYHTYYHLFWLKYGSEIQEQFA